MTVGEMAGYQEMRSRPMIRLRSHTCLAGQTQVRVLLRQWWQSRPVVPLWFDHGIPTGHTFDVHGVVHLPLAGLGMPVLIVADDKESRPVLPVLLMGPQSVRVVLPPSVDRRVLLVVDPQGISGDLWRTRRGFDVGVHLRVHCWAAAVVVQGHIPQMPSGPIPVRLIALAVEGDVRNGGF